MNRKIVLLFICVFLAINKPTVEAGQLTPVDNPVAAANNVLTEPELVAIQTPDAGLDGDDFDIVGEVNAEVLLSQAKKLANDWNTLDWIARLVALIGLLLAALRYKPIDDWLESKQLKYIKPYLSLGLGTLGGCLVATIGGAPWHQAILSGLIAGAATPGVHQLLTKANR